MKTLLLSSLLIFSCAKRGEFNADSQMLLFLEDEKKACASEDLFKAIKINSIEALEYAIGLGLETECLKLAEAGLALPAYEQCVKSSHVFNLLDARGVISVTDRAQYIRRVRTLSLSCANAWNTGECNA